MYDQVLFVCMLMSCAEGLEGVGGHEFRTLMAWVMKFHLPLSPGHVDGEVLFRPLNNPLLGCVGSFKIFPDLVLHHLVYMTYRLGGADLSVQQTSPTSARVCSPKYYSSHTRQ